jgi:DNA polymerase-1
MKLAMIRVESGLLSCGFEAQLLMQIHDELVLECEESKVADCIDLVRREMEHVAEFRVPLKVEAGSGRNWEEAHG